MRYRILKEEVGRRRIAVAMEVGDRVAATLLGLATELDLHASVITGIGGFREVTLGYFDVEDGTYSERELDEQFEVLSFVGNLSREEGDDSQHLHAHVVLGRSDATTCGGHLVEATVRPTLELMLEETPGNVPRGMDERTGWVLLKP